MKVEEASRALIVRNTAEIENKKEMLNSLDLAIAEHYCNNNNFDKGLQLYKELLPKLSPSEKDIAVHKYLRFLITNANLLQSKQDWIQAIERYRESLEYSNIPIGVYKNIGLCLKAIGNPYLAINFLKHYEELSPEKEDVYIYIADIAYSDLKDNVKAIEYYEKALAKNPNNFSIYNMLGHLYSTTYQDKFKEKQIEYLEKAFQLQPNNRIVVKNLAYVYGKFDEIQKAVEMYAKLMYLNPTHSDLHAYGAYLIKHKRFTEGFKFLQHRFEKENIKENSFPQIHIKEKDKQWNLKCNISNKHILVHYEQGYGDSIMFVRFLDELKKKCAKVSLVIQDSLTSLFKDSKLGVDIIDESDISKINFDYWISMMDLPIVCETTADNIPKADGYLTVPKKLINEYKKLYIQNNDNLKIGIAYEGTLTSKETDRDIPLKYFYPLMNMEGIEIYCFQVSDLNNQLNKIPSSAKLINLGNTFKDWQTTASAIKNMDLMITTDNSILNLAGALGVKTFGLFNKIVEWRWFQTTGKDVAWYKSVRPFQAPSSKEWETPIAEIIKEVEKLQCKKIAKRIKNITS